MEKSSTVELGEPVLKGDAAKDALLENLKATEREFKALGLPFGKAEKEEARYRFCASEAYLGPMTAKTFAGWAHRELKIQTKQGHLVPFLLNPMQFRFAKVVFDDINPAKKMVRIVVLKARQFGFSTLIEAISYFYSSVERHFNSTIIAHKGEATTQLYSMARRFHKNLRFRPRTERYSGKGIVFADPHDSSIRLDTAENKEAGRSTTARLVHASEVAFWPWADTTRLGLVQTVGQVPGTFIFEESTANGVGGTFHDQYWRAKEGKGEYRALFFPWFENPDYAVPLRHSTADEVLGRLDREETHGRERWGWTPEQILWRRVMIEDACEGDIGKFHQEYPSTDRQAFLVSGSPVFDQELVTRRMERVREPIFQGRLTTQEV